MIYILSMLFLLFSPAKKYELELNLKEGEIYYQNITATSTMTQNIQGTTQNVDMESSSNSKFEVVSVTENGYVFDVSFVWMELSMESGVINQSFSSRREGDDVDMMSKILKELTKKPFSIEMTSKGEVTAISGIDELYSQALSQFPEMSEMEKQQVRAQMSQAYGKAAIKGSVEQLSSIFPSKKVSIGDTWTKSIELQSGMEATQDATFELVEVTDEFVTIRMNSEIATADKDAYVQIGGSEAKYLISGTGTATLKLDRKTLWTVEGDISQKFSGTIELQPGPQAPNGMEIPIEYEVSTVIKDR
ncbi:DUF6263 family protein [Halocola ammonii]